MGKRSLAIALALLTAAAACAAGTAAARVPNLNWTALLPPLPSPVKPQPGPVTRCRRPSSACVATEIRRMRRLQRRLGCDHGGVFATTYLELTRTLRRMLASHPHLFRHPRYLYTEDALFADVYFATLRRWQRGQGVDPAWRIAFRTAASGDANAAQDMLLGINAHVQNDMPFVLAALGLRTPTGASRKHDHDAFNAVLNRAYAPVVHAVRRRYDPIVGTTNSDATPLDDFAGLELVRAWREQVWRNAELLLDARSAAQRAAVARQIHANAAAWARAIATPQQPGHRARRDAYCEQQLRAR